MQTISKVLTRVVLSSPSERNNTVPSTEALLKLPDQEQTASLPPGDVILRSNVFVIGQTQFGKPIVRLTST